MAGTRRAGRPGRQCAEGLTLLVKSVAKGGGPPGEVVREQRESGVQRGECEDVGLVVAPHGGRSRGHGRDRKPRPVDRAGPHRRRRWHPRLPGCRVRAGAWSTRSGSPPPGPDLPSVPASRSAADSGTGSPAIHRHEPIIVPKRPVRQPLLAPLDPPRLGIPVCGVPLRGVGRWRRRLAAGVDLYAVMSSVGAVAVGVRSAAVLAGCAQRLGGESLTAQMVGEPARLRGPRRRRCRLRTAGSRDGRPRWLCSRRGQRRRPRPHRLEGRGLPHIPVT